MYKMFFLQFAGANVIHWTGTVFRGESNTFWLYVDEIRFFKHIAWIIFPYRGKPLTGLFAPLWQISGLEKGFHLNTKTPLAASREAFATQRVVLAVII